MKPLIIRPALFRREPLLLRPCMAYVLYYEAMAVDHHIIKQNMYGISFFISVSALLAPVLCQFVWYTIPRFNALLAV